MYIHVCTWYVHGIYIPGYKRVCTSFRHVCTFMEIYRHVHTFLLMIYKHVCTWYRHVYTFDGINMHVHSSDVYVHV